MRAIIAIVLAMSSSMTAHITPASRFVQRPDSAGKNERMIGAVIAADNAAPYQIYMIDSAGRSCGGSILNERWIITAGHCVDDPSEAQSIKIHVGSNHWASGGRFYESEDSFAHEGWDGKNNDIGLVKTRDAIEFDERVQPIRLATENTPAGVEATVTGFGLTYPPHFPPPPEYGRSLQKSDRLQTLNVTTIKSKTCGKIWAHLGEELSSKITPKMLCTFTRKGEGMCYGDSGSPLVYNGEMVGIVSFGWPCAQGIPDVFTRVYSYVDWIESHTQLP